MSKNEYDVEGGDEYGRKLPRKLSAAVVTARAVSLISLIVCVGVFHTNYDGYAYKRVFSYKYALSAALFGFAANFFCAIHYVVKKKVHMLISSPFLKACFYLDMTAAILVATGAGAAFCATVDLKRVQWVENNSERQSFYSVGYIAAAFLIMGCITTVASSVHSSLALTHINTSS